MDGIRSAVNVNRNAADAASRTRFSRFLSNSFEIARTLTTVGTRAAAPQAMQCDNGRKPSDICIRQARSFLFESNEGNNRAEFMMNSNSEDT